MVSGMLTQALIGVKEFVMENAGPKALKMIGNMLGDKDDEDDDE